MQATTQAPCFPNAEILAGCRKAPIMTIGINPNLTAFAPGQMGAAWCYPSFSATGNGDASAKYAWYSRHRSIYQERFDLSFIRQYLLTTGQIIAPNPGVILGAARASNAPHFTITVRYDGDSAEQELPIVENTGEPRYVLLFDTQAPNNRFAKGDVIAARLDVPPGQDVPVYRQPVGYYQQFVPVLQLFASDLAPTMDLQMGEDVCQLDMVACASPRWNPEFLGGSAESVSTLIRNCVAQNAWAIKQLVQTQPAVLFLVGESS